MTEHKLSVQTASPGQQGPERRLSFFALTAGGSLLALKLQEQFGGTAYLPSCQTLGCGHCSSFESISQILPERFAAGDTVVCIMASGIVFRVLAPHLKAKRGDPAVIVMDEEGRHVIPLLGGHAAGANALARELAGFLGGRPALTTSSDVQGLIAPDEVAQRLGARVDDWTQLRRVTALLCDAQPVCIEAERDPGIAGYSWIAPGGDTGPFAGRLLVTHELAGPAEAELPTARLLAPRLVAGVGCRRGTAADEIIAALELVCRQQGVDRRSLAALASIDVKEDEAGLREAAERLGLPLSFFPAAELAALGRPGNSFVAAQVGTPAVAEPAALKAAGAAARLLVAKTAVGPVTVSLALRSPLPEFDPQAEERPARQGQVYVVGTGAGTAALLTEEARRALVDADVIVGYRTYTEQIKRIMPGKKFVAGAMGAEIKRCRQALDLAREGLTVALVSSGDPGVYGMAGLLLEIAGDTPVSVFPGVTSAQIAAALLGAPLMNDYVTLSLSDLLTPREEVLRRAETVAASDLVICLYNPSSKNRRPLFEEVCALLARHRPGATLVGWVRDAGGPEQQVKILPLADLTAQEIDMRSLIIVGGSNTRLINGKMVTVRGYQKKKEFKV